MKKFVTVIGLILIAGTFSAQNIGIGTIHPYNKLQVEGSLVVNSPSLQPSNAPSVAQTKTMVNGSTIIYDGSDSTGRFYDPGGSAGNYNANLSASLYTGLGNNTGIEVTAELMDLGSGDSLIITDDNTNQVLLAVGNGYSTLFKWVFNARVIIVQFRSNSDAVTGAGFSLLFKKLYDNSSALPQVSGYSGNTFFFNAKNGALRSGKIANTLMGNWSAAIGYSAIASGNYSTAFGIDAKATGEKSLALGSNTQSTGDFSTSIGVVNLASGYGSTAIGSNSISDNLYSTAIGKSVLATGEYAVAIGNGTEAAGKHSTAMGINSKAESDYSTALGRYSIVRGFGGTAVGMFNDPILAAPQTVITATTPVFIIGNGDGSGSLRNAMVVTKNGNTGLGTNFPVATLHIKHESNTAGGLILENAGDGNRWRLYSASGDNNLTFFNDAGAEVADIDDVTGTFNALSDSRYKKNIEKLGPVLPSLMQLAPSYYLFNWQQPLEQKQIGMMAQETIKVFPELVSYNSERDLYKMNYAGFSVVAIKAIQEQQVLIEELNKKIRELEIRIRKNTIK